MGDLHRRWFVGVGFLIISIAYSEFWSGGVGVDCDGDGGVLCKWLWCGGDGSIGKDGVGWWNDVEFDWCR